MAETPSRTNGPGSLDAYRAYFEALPCYVSVQDANLQLVEANRLFRQRFGEKLGRRCWEVCRQRASACPDCPVERTFRTGQTQQAEEMVKSSQGDEIPIMVYTSPIHTQGGAVSHVLQILADISEVRRLQRRLQRAEQKFHRIFDEAPCYVTVQDRELRLTAANRRFKEDFGDEPGLHCYEAYKHRSEPCLECPVMRTFHEGTPQRSEEVVTAISGRQYNVLVQTAPLRDPDGHVTEVMEMSTNITELRELEGQLASLGLLIGSVSHGAKGLLTAIDGGMYLVNSGMARNDEARVHEGWGVVKRNVARVRSMILDILYYSKERGLDCQPLDTLELASEVISLVSGRAEELGIELESKFALNGGRIEADNGALRSALVNILENAFDACRIDRKKPNHRVSFSVDPESPDGVVFQVEDNGLGMDRETMEKAFTLFFSSKGNEGTGLGLFVAHRIVQQHGGSIELRSTPEVGTRVRVHLPRLQPVPCQSSPGAPADANDDDLTSPLDGS